MRASEVKQCSSFICVGESRVEIHCERGDDHGGKHREFFESTDEHTKKHVSVIIEWLEQDQ